MCLSAGGLLGYLPFQASVTGIANNDGGWGQFLGIRVFGCMGDAGSHGASVFMSFFIYMDRVRTWMLECASVFLPCGSQGSNPGRQVC